MEKDLKAVEEMEQSCDVGPTSSSSKTKKKNRVLLSVDLLGDPLCRVRHVPDHIMLVAEHGKNQKTIAGVIRACIKNVTRGIEQTCHRTRYVRVAYVLGLRVSSAHRQVGIGTKLVQRVESWCIQKGAEYVYMATDRSNIPSLNLFTRKLSYIPLRSLAILTQPVHAHSLSLPSNVTILKLSSSLSIPLYQKLFSNSEFFPSDIASLLANPLTLGTYISIHRDLPDSFAIMSLWNAKKVFRLKVSGVSSLTKIFVKRTHALDKMWPCLKVPSFRDVFSPFGVYIMYGMHAVGEGSAELMRCLCKYAHNMAMKEEDIAAVVCEIGVDDREVKDGVLHWKKFSCDEDVWCMKKLVPEDGCSDDWSKSMPSTGVIFVDPREF